MEQHGTDGLENFWGLRVVNYFLDIETQGLNPAVDEIITIQIQKLN